MHLVAVAPVLSMWLHVLGEPPSFKYWKNVSLLHGEKAKPLLSFLTGQVLIIPLGPLHSPCTSVEFWDQSWTQLGMA